MTEARMIPIPEMTLQRWASRLEAGGTHGWEDRLAADIRAYIAKEKAPDVTLTMIHEDGEPAGMQVHFSLDFDVVLHNLPAGAQVHLHRIGANPSGDEP